MTTSQAPGGAGRVVGAACWTLTVAYLLVQPAVAAAWPIPYDLTVNSISDLGVTGCGDFRRPEGGVVHACSPWHALMNAVFVAVGVLTVHGAGALLQVPGAAGPVLLARPAGGWSGRSRSSPCSVV